MNDKKETPTQDLLHGVTLKSMLETLVETYGFEELGDKINIRCFQIDPSISSSLKFLRKTPWARTKVERLYLRLAKKLKKRGNNTHSIKS